MKQIISKQQQKEDNLKVDKNNYEKKEKR